MRIERAQKARCRTLSSFFRLGVVVFWFFEFIAFWGLEKGDLASISPFSIKNARRAASRLSPDRYLFLWMTLLKTGPPEGSPVYTINQRLLFNSWFGPNARTTRQDHKVEKFRGDQPMPLLVSRTKVKAENTALTDWLRFHLLKVFVGCRCNYFRSKK